MCGVELVRARDIIEAVIAGLLLLLLTVGLGVIITATPVFTHYVSAWTGAAELSGLDPEIASRTAEQVRAFVVGASVGSPPAEVAGRPGFDTKTTSHLLDVRAVIHAVRTGAGLAAAFLAAWAAWCLARGRVQAMSRGLRTGAVMTGAAMLASGVFAVADFDAAFLAFHGFFFEEGTWTFASDSLIIQLFPAGFWVASGALLVIWGLLCSALMLWGSVAVKRPAGMASMTTR